MKNATIVDPVIAVSASVVSPAAAWLTGTALPAHAKHVDPATPTSVGSTAGEIPTVGGSGMSSAADRLRTDISIVPTGVTRLGARASVQDRHGSFPTFPNQGSYPAWDRLS